MHTKYTHYRVRFQLGTKLEFALSIKYGKNKHSLYSMVYLSRWPSLKPRHMQNDIFFMKSVFALTDFIQNECHV
jgi:hypothetical protein